MIFKLMFHMVF